MKYFGAELREDLMPIHIGIIMDGNGRWATQRGFPRAKGHQEGFATLKRIVEANRTSGVKFLSFYAFSTENWNRPKDEVGFLMKLADQLVGEYCATLIENDIRLWISGTFEGVEPALEKRLMSAVERTKHCGSYVLNIAFNYGGRKEILDAMKKAFKDLTEHKITPEELTEESFRQYFYHPELPDVDLVIRPSGEMRLSNFLLWQTAYAEYWSTQKFWPDFKPEDFAQALADYQKRDRRFGKV